MRYLLDKFQTQAKYFAIKGAFSDHFGVACQLLRGPRHTTTIPKLDYIDALRGIAIIMVVACHASQLLPATGVLGFGQMGVQLFFLTSALTLCISSQVRAASSNTPKGEILAFYIRRFFRIFPLYYTAIFLNSAVRIFTASGTEDPFELSSVIWNFLLLHGLVPKAMNSVVPGGWSIGAEVLFYCIFPFLLRIARSGFKVYVVSGFLSLVALGAIFVAQRKLGLLRDFGNNTPLYFSFFIQMPVFLLGIATYLHLFPAPGVRPLWPPKVVLATFCSAGVLLFKWHQEIYFAIIPWLIGNGFTLMVTSLTKGFPGLPGVVREILVLLGRYSYGIYICHFAVLLFLIEPFTRTDKIREMLGPILYFVVPSVTLGICWVVARLLHASIEAPGIQLGGQLIKYLRSRNEC